MSEQHATPQPGLTVAERQVLAAALHEPLFDRDPLVMGICLRLCGRKLMQRAGGVSAANGWRGTPHAFVLTREGWNLLKAQHRAPLRRAV